MDKQFQALLNRCATGMVGRLVLILGLAMFLVPVGWAEQLRLHVDRSIYIDVDFDNRLKGKVEELQNAALRGAPKRDLMEIQKQITNEIYRGALNTSTPPGVRFAVRKGQILVLNEGGIFGSVVNQPHPMMAPSADPELRLEGDVLIGEQSDASVHLLDFSDLEMGHGSAVGSVNFEEGDLYTVGDVLFGPAGSLQGTGIIMSAPTASDGSHVKLISDFLDEPDREEDVGPSGPQPLAPESPAVFYPTLPAMQ